MIFASQSWVRSLPFLALLVVFVFIQSRLLQIYEKSGQAVPIARSRTIIKFVNGKPAPILALRNAFFVIAAMMIVFGVAPFVDRTARIGIIGCVLSLFMVGLLHVALELHYVNTGRAKEIPIMPEERKQ
jgi:hypothetical protein